MGALLRTVIRLAIVAWIATLVAAVIGAVRAKREAPPLPDTADDEIHLQSVFEGLDFRSTATAFRGGTLVCWFGGGNLDLRDATLDRMGARLEVRAIFGGGSILVRDEWNVSVRVVGIGGAADARPAADRDLGAPTLTIEGMALFGGFGVVSELPRGTTGSSEPDLAAIVD